MPQETASSGLVGDQLPASWAAGQVAVDAVPLFGRQQIVGIGRQRLTNATTLAHAVSLVFRN
jgi:hypothetical protein